MIQHRRHRYELPRAAARALGAVVLRWFDLLDDQVRPAGPRVSIDEGHVVHTGYVRDQLRTDALAGENLEMRRPGQRPSEPTKCSARSTFSGVIGNTSFRIF